MKRTFQIIAQVVFLILFIALTITGKIQLWMGVFVGSVLLTLILGRFYCGWICPINTMIKAVNWIKKKLHIKSIKVPNALKKSWIRYVFLGLFFATLVFTLVSHKKLPVLPALAGIGVIISMIFSEELWHCYMCPYGTILSIPGRKSVNSLKIDQDKCVSCGLCYKVCPAEAISINDGKYEIIKKDCLLCMECEINCPVNAISYNNKKDNHNG